MFEKFSYLWRYSQEFLVPEVITLIPQKFDKGDNQTPGVRAMDKEPLEKDFRCDLLEFTCINLFEKV